MTGMAMGVTLALASIARLVGVDTISDGDFLLADEAIQLLDDDNTMLTDSGDVIDI